MSLMQAQVGVLRAAQTIPTGPPPNPRHVLPRLEDAAPTLPTSAAAGCVYATFLRGGLDRQADGPVTGHGNCWRVDVIDKSCIKSPTTDRPSGRHDEPYLRARWGKGQVVLYRSGRWHSTSVIGTAPISSCRVAPSGRHFAAS
jgi:hypothetical protein